MTEPERVERVRSLLPATQWSIEALSPDDWQHVAAFLTGLLLRRPLSTGENEIKGWAAERLILGCLASELRLLAHEAGEPEMVPRTFGVDPLEKARALVAELAELHEVQEADRARRIQGADELSPSSSSSVRGRR